MNLSQGIYWDQSWSPIRGCSHASPGCDHCWAERMAARFSDCWTCENKRIDQHQTCSGGPKHHPAPFHNFATSAGWTGRVELIESELLKPLHWKKPRVVALNWMGDLFHESLPESDILSVLQTIGKCPRHWFIILTKRAQRMREILSRRRWRNLGHSPAMDGDHYVSLLPGEHRESDSSFLPNVILGVSVEDRQRADERIPGLLQTPAACRMVSVEPMLGAIEGIELGRGYLTGQAHDNAPYNGKHLDWVVCGGESGPGARPMHPDWVRGLRDQCWTASVPFFWKGWGEFSPVGLLSAHQEIVCGADGWHAPVGDVGALSIHHMARHNSEMECPPLQNMYRIGKKAAGRLLDGRTWDELPEVLR